jgi:putative MFS transporter
MAQSTVSGASRTPRARTVQGYIDETPFWADGTAARDAPMTFMQWRIWWLSVAGKFFEGLIVFMTGVALPLVGKEFDLTATQHGMVSAAAIFGILVGASALGSLSDYFGRKPMFVFEIVLFTLFLVLIVFAQNFVWLVICLFGLGLALGCDYPTAHMMISESTPSRSRGRLVLGAFGFQAAGALAGTAVGYVVLSLDPAIEAWRWMYASAIIPAILVAIGRLYITESPQWLVVTRRRQDAERELQRLLKRMPPYPSEVSLAEASGDAPTASGSATGYGALFKRKNLRALILASVPWFLQDLSTYGIGIFTPTILALTLGHEQGQAMNIADLVDKDLLAAKGAAVIDILLLAGIFAAVLLADKFGRIRLQVVGFIGCAAGLFIAAQSSDFEGPTKLALIFVGFMLFNFMTNLGPNAQTYLIAGEVFPTAVRGKGAGFAASFAKVGGCLTAFLFPIVLVDFGTTLLLSVLVCTSLLGALVTWMFRIETTGIDLETAGAEPSQTSAPEG